MGDYGRVPLEVMMIRPVRRFVSFALLLAFPVFAPAQEKKSDSETKKGPPVFSSSAVQRSYSAGAAVPARVTQTRTESNGREVLVETTEVPGTDGKMKMSLETTTETVRTGANSSQTKQERYTSDQQGRRQLLDTTQNDTEKLTDGTARSTANTWAPDLNGKLGLSTREVQESRSTAPGVTETNKSIYRSEGGGPLRESERVQQTERKVSSAVTESESKRFIDDGNGRWQAAEVRNQEVRDAGKERVIEETVRRPDTNGALAVSERSVTRETKGNGTEETVTETYSQNITGLPASGSSLPLAQRVRITASETAGGGRETVREVEARSPANPTGPLRVVERTVETLRQVGPDRWEVERKVFALDANGRLSPVLTDKGVAKGK
jgi:hypothetical protein